MSVRSLWASVQGDPVFMRRVNGWLTLLWLAMIPVSLATGWVNSVAYVSALSLWASRIGPLFVGVASSPGRGEASDSRSGATPRSGTSRTSVVQKLVTETDVTPGVARFGQSSGKVARQLRRDHDHSRRS